MDVLSRAGLKFKGGVLAFDGKREVCCSMPRISVGLVNHPIQL